MTVHCELIGVRKAYGDRTVLDNVNLRIDAGDMIAITGPSGSGKSTVLNMMGLLDTPDVGRVRLFDAPAPKPRTRAATRLLRHRLGYLFQNFALIDGETVEHNLKIALAYADKGTPNQQRIADALDAVGLPGAERRRVFSLSGGEQQRIAVARLLLKPCDLVLADEPTGALDDDNRDAMLGLLQKLNKSGKTIVIVTHDTVVANACTRTVTID